MTKNRVKIAVAPLDIKLMGSQVLIQGPKFPTPYFLFVLN